MTIPTMTPVQSSYLTEVGHDGDALYIRFKPPTGGSEGPLFRYPTAGRDVHEALLAAESIGKHFHANIKGRHQGERVGE